MQPQAIAHNVADNVTHNSSACLTGANRHRARRLLFVAMLAIVATFACLPAATFAQESPANPAPEPTTTETSSDPAAETPPKLDEELLNDLSPESIDEQLDVDALEKAVDGMRTATDRLESGDLGDDTQSLQRKAVSELDRLIDLIKKQQQRDNQQQQQQQQNQEQQQQDQQDQQQQQQQNQQQNQQQQQSKPQSKKKMSRLQKQLQQERQRQRQKQQQQQQRQMGMAGGRMPRPQSQQPEPKPGGEDSPQPQDSSKELRERKLQQEKEKQRQAINDVWGHLPPQVRQELQSLYSEKYLPKYDELVRRYYEALAARSRKQRPRPTTP